MSKKTRNKSALARAAASATPTGCTRPESLFGLWAIEPGRFAEMVEMAKSMDLVALAESRRAVAGTPDGPLPTLSPETPGEKGADLCDDNDDSLDFDPEDDEDLPYRKIGNVALFDVSGPMTKYQTSFQDILGGTSTLQLRQAIRAAARDPDIQCGLLCIESPGGTVAGMSDLAADIRTFDVKWPMFAYISDLGCSAAYWAASQCREIYANSNALIGCVGTMAILRDTSKAFEQQGVKVMVVASDTDTGETMKGAGADGTPITDDQLADFKRQVNEQNDLFVADVAAGRIKIPNVRALADGRVHVGAKAKALGLVDEINSFDVAFQAITTKAQSMNAESFKAFASANPEDATVKSLHAQGHKAGEAKGRADARTELGTMLAAFQGRETFAAQQFVKGNDVLAAKAEYADVLTAELTTANQKLAAAEQAKAAVVAQHANDNPPIRLPGTSAAAVAAQENKAPDAATDPVAAFEAAWQAEAKKPGVSTDRAIANVVRDKPELHAAYLTAMQATRKAR